MTACGATPDVLINLLELTSGADASGKPDAVQRNAWRERPPCANDKIKSPTRGKPTKKWSRVIDRTDGLHGGCSGHLGDDRD